MLDSCEQRPFRRCILVENIGSHECQSDMSNLRHHREFWNDIVLPAALSKTFVFMLITTCPVKYIRYLDSTVTANDRTAIKPHAKNGNMMKISTMTRLIPHGIHHHIQDLSVLMKAEFRRDRTRILYPKCPTSKQE